MGDQVEATTTKLGLEAFGAEGEPFDPTIHEAMTHSEGKAWRHRRCRWSSGSGYGFRAGSCARPGSVSKVKRKEGRR